MADPEESKRLSAVDGLRLGAEHDENDDEEESGSEELSEEESAAGDDEDDEAVRSEDDEVERASIGDNEEERLEAEVTELKEKLFELRSKLASTELEQNPARQKEFLAAYDRYMRPQSDQVHEKVSLNERNLLYALANSNSRGENPAWLVKYLIEKYPTLLEERDDSHRNPLVWAISFEKHYFIRAIVDSNMDPEILARVIEAPWLTKENSLHVAISNNFDPELTIKLIEKASKHSFEHQNERQLTPLHLAVEYTRCTKARLGVVLALIKYGDIAFDCRTGKPDNLSVYQYHKESKRKYTKAAKADDLKGEKKKKKRDKDKIPEGAAKGAKDKAPASTQDDKLKPAGPSSTQDGKLKLVAPSSVQDGKVKPAVSTSTQDDKLKPVGAKVLRVDTGLTNQAQRLAYQANETRAYSPAKVDAPVKLDAPAIASAPPGSVAGAGSVKSGGTKTTRSKPKKSAQELPDPEVADTIAMELQLHYLRSTFHQKAHSHRRDECSGYTGGQTQTKVILRNHDSAIRFLYGENKNDKQICFEFPAFILKESEKIDFENFETSYKGLKFDAVLQNVEFRQLELKTLKARRAIEGFPGTGRKDMKRFFDWLYLKGVRHIIRVSVEDREGVPHSDEIIEASLERFNFEILDWRKVDLDPRVIHTACRNSKLRQLHLWWSGNNALLRAWSEPDGLPQLPNLEQICIHQTKNSLDSSERTAKNLEEFKDRLKKRRGDAKLGAIVVHHDKPDDHVRSTLKTHMQARDPERVQIDTHRWLNIMDKFADGISALNPLQGFPQDYMKNLNLPPDLRRDVTVALIDDGVNFMHRAIADKIENGRSFDNAYEDPDFGGAPDPFHGSTTGHGTYMAYMIGRVCPGVKIFVCKLNVLRREGGEKASFTAKSAADAVEFAVSRGFDIISMSWTVQKLMDAKNDNSEHINRLEKALKTAAERDHTLIFCSAPDIGLSSEQALSNYYPFGSMALANSIFKIGAAKADGTTYGWTGDSRSVDFILPGHNVELRGEDRITEEDDTPKTGSSVATALAAGLAALIIHCVRLGAICNYHQQKGNDPNAVNEDALRAIKRSSSMREAFSKVGFVGQDRKDRNLDVEHFFKEPGQVISRDNGVSDEKKWIKITQLARDLMPFNTQTRAS